MRASLRELLFTEDKLYPPRLGSLAAWYDSLDPVTMLAGNGTQITDGGSVALWKDKSGNSGVNALVGNGQATNERAWLPTGSNVGIGEASVSARFLVQTQTSPFATPVFLASGNTTSVIAKSLSIRTASGSLIVVLFGVTTSDFNAWTYSNFVTNYNNRKVTVCVTRGLSGNPKIYIDAVDVTASGAFSTGGTAPTWQGEITSTHTVFGGGLVNASFVGPVYSARVYLTELSASDVISDSDGLIPDGNVVAVDFTTAPTKLTNGDTFTCATGQTVTLNSSGATGARIAGERDLYQGTAANRPVYLKYEGTKYGYLNGVSGTNFSTPDSAATSLTLNADLVWDGSLDDWTPASNTALISKYDGNFVGYELRVTTTGLLTLIIGNGSAAEVINSTAGLGATGAGVRKAVRVAFVSDTGAGQYSATFYAGDSIAEMVQLGDVVSGTSIAPADGTQVLYVGARVNTSNLLFGRVYYASVGGTVDGAPTAIFNPALYTSGTTFTASTGEVWTINGGAHIVTRTGLYFDGSNDYLKSAAFSLSQPETVYFTGEQVTWTSGDVIYDGNTGFSVALWQASSSPLVLMYAANSAPSSTDWTIKSTAIVSNAFNGASSTIRVNRGAANLGNAGTNAANGFTLGLGFVNKFGNVFVSEVAIYSAADATATQDRIALYAGRKWGFTV